MIIINYVCSQYTAEQAWHLGATRVLALLGLPSLTMLLHLARLRHLQSCVVVGIPEFWALAHVEGAWLASRFGADGPDAHTAWTPWRSTMLSFAGQ